MFHNREEFLDDLSDSQLIDNDTALDNAIILPSEFVSVYKIPITPLQLV